ncbi:MAG: glycoside hydrolase [Treponema sp.]|nr:glycoside hydrolase [Treponema sp.]
MNKKIPETALPFGIPLSFLFVLTMMGALSACHSAPPPPVETEVIVPSAEAEADTLAEEEEEEEEETPFWEDLSADVEGLPVSTFGETWAYLISGQEQYLKANYPLTDVGYFGAEVDAYGKLTGVPNPQKIAYFPGRKHLVVACNGRGLTHFVLEPESRTRRLFVADLLEAAKNFDGLQIDFEAVPARDGDAFRSFLAELREGLAKKSLTIALPARVQTLGSDVYDYRKILPLVDRIFVMAYDEHWSTSAPGPIASLNWSRRVAKYALDTVGAEKLIMGLPFYGRTWGNINTFRAFFYSGIQRIIAENHVTDIRREEGIPTFTYEIPVKVTVYYEDAHSLAARLSMYRAMGARAVGFWCLGQETPAVWRLLQVAAH